VRGDNAAEPDLQCSELTPIFIGIHRNAPLSPINKGARVHHSYGSYAPSTYVSYEPRRANPSTGPIVFTAPPPSFGALRWPREPDLLGARPSARRDQHEVAAGRVAPAAAEGGGTVISTRMNSNGSKSTVCTLSSQYQPIPV
jgi:hypothetical protein